MNHMGLGVLLWIGRFQLRVSLPAPLSLAPKQTLGEGLRTTGRPFSCMAVL